MAERPLKRCQMLAALLLPVACSGAAERGPITLSHIGSSEDLLDQATRQGLVTLDSSGGIAPALAERWIVIDDGLSYVFRLKEANWSDGKPVTAGEVAVSLRRSLAGRGSALEPLFDNVASVVAMTDRVIEIRLRRPQPLFIQLLALPDASVTRAGVGTGPYLVHSRRNGITRLRPVTPPGMAILAEDVEPSDADDVRFRNETSATAIARFSLGHIDGVSGGTLADLPVARAARPPSEQLKIEIVRGLFGLAIADPRGALADISVRKALSLAVERNTLGTRLGMTNWPAATSSVPGQPSANPEDDLAADAETRLARARALLDGKKLEISIGLPPGPGMNMLHAALQADWARIGVTLRRAAPRARPDLKLVDEVAPVNSLIWFVSRLGCRQMPACDEDSDIYLEGALTEGSQEARQSLLARASGAAEASHNFIPLGRPLRWSLIGPQLTGWRASPVAQHPLNDLRPPAR